jgi:hypothetical protein
VLNENNGASGVTVFNFQFSGMARTQTADAIALSSNLDIGLMSAGVAPVMSATTNELMVELFTAASQVITLGSTAADEGVGVIALMTSLAEDGYYATISEVLAAMGSGGAGGLSLASAIVGTTQLNTAGNVLVLFSDGTDSYLYQVGLTATVNATFTATNTDVTLLATFDSTDITTFSGTNFDGIFEID